MQTRDGAVGMINDKASEVAVHPPKERLSVVVVGAGIGGLTVALALRMRGHRVVVLEQANELGEVGAGLQLHPNATRVLLSLGLRDALAKVAVVPDRAVQRRWDNGEILSDLTLGKLIEEKYGAPYWHLHRADLHDALLDAAKSPDGFGEVVEVRLAQRVTDVKNDADRAEVFTEGNTTSIYADVVIGADGLHSVIRGSLFGSSKPLYSGEICYRGFVTRSAIEQNEALKEIAGFPALNMWMGPGRHIVHYLVRGGELMNFIFVVRAEEGAAIESWSDYGESAEMEKELEGWDPRVRQLAQKVENIHKWALYDREPLSSGTDDRVCLLGDAYHPMLPYQSQGAGQAIEDAGVLAGVLSQGYEVRDALQLYGVLRTGQTAHVQGASRESGNLYHLEDGLDQQNRDRSLREQSGRYYERPEIWSYDALAEGQDVKKHQTLLQHRKG